MSVNGDITGIFVRRQQEFTLNLQFLDIPNPHFPNVSTSNLRPYPSMNCNTFPLRLHCKAPPCDSCSFAPSPSFFSSRKALNFSAFKLHAQIRNSPLVEGLEASSAMSSADDLWYLPSFSVYVRGAENSGRHARLTIGVVCACACVYSI